MAKQAVKKLELWFTTQGIPPSCITTNLPLINSLERFLTVIILLHADPQVIYYYCVMFTPYQFIAQGVALMKHVNRLADRQWDGQTDGQGDSYILHQNVVYRGILRQNW